MKKTPQIFEGQLKEMEHMIGEKVLVTGKDGVTVGGDLQFVGYNKLFPSWGLHCTVDRMPGIHINSVADIRSRPAPFTITKTPQQ